MTSRNFIDQLLAYMLQPRAIGFSAVGREPVNAAQCAELHDQSLTLSQPAIDQLVDAAPALFDITVFQHGFTPKDGGRGRVIPRAGICSGSILSKLRDR